MKRALRGLQMHDHGNDAKRLIGQHRHRGTDYAVSRDGTPAKYQNKEQRQPSSRAKHCYACRNFHVAHSAKDTRKAAEKPKTNRPAEQNVGIRQSFTQGLPLRAKPAIDGRSKDDEDCG
jgi:hypothetical protein